ncbi:MAG TPA: PrkA family serine protein kinase [Burkholderiales bacterium]|nr:PrkA family serine protein kinase [Burkholderiales bacterium]
MDLLNSYKTNYSQPIEATLSIPEYLDLCKSNPMSYATAAERMLAAIGEPEVIDTRNSQRLSRIFSNRMINRYPAFRDFFGLEEIIPQIVAFFTHAAQGLEESRQVLYLLGPVGGGKSSLAERLKTLMEAYPIYVLKDNERSELSPLNESPLGVFPPEKYGVQLEARYGIEPRYLTGIASPWVLKRLREYGGDLTKFSVVRIHPSALNQIAIAKVEPGDDNNQDISSLVGKVDIRKLDRFSQDDPDAYSYSGGLCLANQGLLEFVEMFKAPIKMLHPLLTATQEGNFKGTEGFGAIPFQGIILAHSNESEWQTFRNNKHNEAFLDRVYLIKIPYCLQVDEEVKIYEKLLRNSSLAHAPCAPQTLSMLAQFSVLTRLKEPENSSIYSKLRVYNGENPRDVDMRLKSIQDYRNEAGSDEGMSGLSTRWAYKALSATFNKDNEEIAADPVHLLLVLDEKLSKEDLPEEVKRRYQEHIKLWLIPRFAEFIKKEIQTAYLESYGEYGQNLFDRYVTYADHWVMDEEYRDPETGVQYDRIMLNVELEKIERPAGIMNPRDFRNEVVHFVLRARANNHGHNPVWTRYEKLKEVIEANMFASSGDLLPVISFGAKTSADHQKKHDSFVERMIAKGYTERQVRLLSDWYQRTRKSEQDRPMASRYHY